MKKTNFMLIAFLFLTCIGKIHAQHAPVTAGGNATGTGGTSSYSIGQVVFATATGAGGTSSQGVQVPFEIVTLSGQQFTQIKLEMKVYPNPTTSFVYLKIDNFNYQNVSYQLFDMNGKQIYNQKITDSETPINMENLTTAVYFLNITNENKTIKTFKINKN